MPGRRATSSDDGLMLVGGEYVEGKDPITTWFTAAEAKELLAQVAQWPALLNAAGRNRGSWDDFPNSTRQWWLRTADELSSADRSLADELRANAANLVAIEHRFDAAEYPLQLRATVSRIHFVEPGRASSIPRNALSADFV